MVEAGSLVLLTGAAGLVGTKLRPALSDYRVRLHDRSLAGCELADHEEVYEGDLADLDGVRRAVDGCAAVIHLAGDRRVHAPWWELKGANIDGAFHVFEAARRAGVRRLIFASTNHVTGMLDKREVWPISPADPLAPDSLYAVSKVFGEALGRYYAENTDLTVVCLRIGWVTEQPIDHPGWRRMWLSDADLGQLVRKCLTADVRFGIYYGVSANTPMHYDLDNARKELGYQPIDDSAAFSGGER